MAYRISYIGLLLALSVLVCCNAIEQQHLRGRGNQKTVRALDGIFSTAYRIVSPQQSYHKRIQTIPAANNNDVLKSTYIQQCQSYLLDDSSITNDGIISQVDFANMLLNQCQLELDMCPHKKLKFEQLDINLQLKFINGICYHQDRVDKFNCIKNLNVMWLEGELFGFELDGDEDVDVLVYDMCTDTYTDAVKMGFARSNAPMLSPSTALPTKQPSLIPSNGPSSQPVSPTISPSSSWPTHSPTVSSIPRDHQSSGIPFVDDCTSYLLSPNALEDGIISQTEYTQFLAHHCIQQELCDEGTVVEFEQLDINLQLEFILGVCNHEDQAGKVQCVTNLEVMWRDNQQFGFDVNDNDMLGIDIMDMCANTYNHVLDMGLAISQAPTKLITASPSQSPEPSQSQPPSASERPSSVINEVGSSTPNDEESIAKGTVLGLSFGLALTVAAAYLVFINHHSDSGPSSEKDISSQKDGGGNLNARQFKPCGEAAVPSLSLSYLGLNNCSISSTSSSFRDYRFTTVFGPKGESIPQFDPNQAAAVVIGSVTIGDSSSYSSGPFTSGSRSTRSFFSFGRRRRKFKSGSSTRDDMSSLSSNRSTSFRREYRALGRHRKGSISRSKSVQSSHSRNTVPLTNRRRQKIDHFVQSNNQVSLGDWNAISYMTAECRNPNQAVTDVGAALQQSKFFFDTLLCPETSQLSDTNTMKSSQSMPNIYRVCSSDAGASVLSESFFLEGSSFILPQSVTDSDSTSHPSNEQFVPWRKEGFNSSLQLSDSCSAVSSSVESHVPESTTKKVLGLVTPTKGAKALFSKCRKKVKARGGFRSLKHRQYHHMNRDLHVVAALQEDGEVGSMISYSSNTNLLPPQNVARTATISPNLIDGSFAAATMPIAASNKQPRYTLETPSPPSQTESVAEDVEEDTPSIDDKIEMKVQPETVTPVQSIQSPRKVAVVQNISSLDICSSEDSENKTQDSESTFVAYSRSDFDSTTVSSKHSRECDSSASNSTGSSQTGCRGVGCSDAKTASLDVSKKYENIEAGDCIADISCLSNSALPNVSTSEDNTTFDDSSSAIHLIGISQILSESESTFESSKCHLNETNLVSNSSESDFSFPSSDKEEARSVKESTTGDFQIDTVIKNPEPVDDVSDAFSSPLHVESESISFDSLVLTPSFDADIETTSMATTVLVNNQAKM